MDNRIGFGSFIEFQSNLEKTGITVRNALKSVSYYKENYPYYDNFYGYDVVRRNEEKVKKYFATNEFGK